MMRAEPHLSDTLLDTLDVGVIVVDREERVVIWNAWIASASGIVAAAAQGKCLEGLFPDASLDRLRQAVADSLGSGATSLITHALHPQVMPLRTPAGQELWHNIAVRAAGEDAGRLCLIQVFDVTAATQRERVLRERQNARYHAVVDSSPDAIVTLDATGRIQLANPAASQGFGYEIGELVGRPADLLFADQSEWDEMRAELLRGEGRQRPLQIVAKRKDGSPSHLEVSASRWISDGRSYMTAILRDVNERHAAEQALLRLNETLEERVTAALAERKRLADMVEATDALIQAVGLDHRLIAVNRAMADEMQRLYGRRPKVGDSYLQPFADDPADATRVRDLWERALSGESFVALERLGRDSDARWYEIKFDVLKDESGTRLAAFQFGHDVTERIVRENQLAETQEALRQSQKMEAVGQLTGGIAHDFNNLLTGIIGSLDVLNRRIRSGRYDDTARFMDAAIASANRAAALTHRLLAFSRRQPLAPKMIDVNRLVRETEELLNRTLGEKIELVIDLAQDLWPVLSDSNQLESALLNLALNARDAMPNGGRLTITTQSARLTSSLMHNGEEIGPGDYAVISVRDTGFGMAPDVLAKVFEPFFTTKPIGQGTGLGLSMIYGFAKQSQGHVQIESAPGKGTAVRLYLPRFTGEAGLAPQLSTRAAPLGRGETVLLIEDDSSVRLLIGEVLRELGYAAIEAIDGQTALPIITSSARIDLMITDVGLPGIDGRRIAEIARQHRPSLKVLFVTGYAEHATDTNRFLDSGMDLLTKPFTLDGLALKIRDMIAPSADAS